MHNPYKGLPKRQFWRSAVSEKSAFTLGDLYKKKFDITPLDRIAVAGSCFAQHVGRNMRERGFNLIDMEPPPDILSPDEAQEQGYGIYSARYGNIYTVRQLLQLINDSRHGTVRDEDFAERNGRWIDLLRPGVEPQGFESLEEAKFFRADHLSKVNELFAAIDHLVFTLGLTEAWINPQSGTVYPVCPATLTENSADTVFHNFDYPEILADLEQVCAMLREANPDLRFLFTVSPVPLTATASDQHVLAATTYSKSVLRAVCGSMAQRHGDVDYFPSYEVITSSLSRGVFYDANLRTVNATGVATAMSIFFGEHDSRRSPGESPAAEAGADASGSDKAEKVVCEEMMLEAFG